MSDEPHPLDRYPDLRPVSQAPSLSTFNTIGFALYGRRDEDPETGAYVATHCFVVAFIPLLALGAYLVMDSPNGGWYFLGRVSLSRFARRYNWLVGLLVLLGGGFGLWSAHTDTPDYKAGQMVAEADRLAGRGEAHRAARLYREVSEGPTARAAAAREKLRGLVEAADLPAEEAAGVFEEAVEVHRRGVRLTDDLYARAAALARRHEETDPRAALALIDVAAPLSPRPGDPHAARKRLLERLTAEKPDDPALASRLAVLCHETGEANRCQALLEPHEARLGQLDGAALLGRLYAAQGKLDRAHALLAGYVDARLPQLRAAEQAYSHAVEAVHNTALEQVRTNAAPGFDMERFKSAPDAQKQTMFGEFVQRRLQSDPGVRSAGKAMAAQAGVVSAAIELGMVRLLRAQAVADPDRRRAELERAEQTLLSVRGQAGQTDQYRLNLGQVSFWLGKHAEGKKLFDAVLAAHGRGAEVLLAVAGRLREVGAVTEARQMAEEAYEKAPQRPVKYAAAAQRFVMATDLEDRIAWLEKGNPDSPEVQASLADSRGRKAEEEGKDDQAAAHYRAAIAVYARQADSAATLNNSALVFFSLYHLTHDPEDFQRGMDRLERAVALQPGDSIVLSNAARQLLEAAVQDVVGAAIDLKVLRRMAAVDLLAYLYRDRAGKDRLVGRLRAHPGYGKARGYFEKLLVLSPRGREAYQWLASLHGYTDDLQGLKAVWAKLQAVEVDREREDQETLDYWAGRKDDKYRTDMKKALARQQKTLPAARAKKGATFAVAAVGLMNQQMGLAALGEKVDADALVALAEEADGLAPSDATRSALIEALVFRAHLALARTDAGYAAAAKKTARSLGAMLVSWVLGAGGDLCDRALANADVRRAVKLKREEARAWGRKSPGAAAWAFLRATHPDEAADAARRCLADKQGAVQRQITALLWPLNTRGVLNAHWVLRMAGKDEQAAAVLRDAAKRGMPLP